ncbi:TetR/AcrR family transcriptional regulator [Microtetraspora niveoalba]|uniref:TetR/AcrR family transcriptional regulator n=1 Tax=Microtetraspora niveoalba TaxID=46175 RepID=UPI000834067D|nr:TetR/AcrR family transcriptional regulator [Microtetraspora niveoalba]
MGARERNKRETHARILKAAKILYAERGVAGTTADDLAQAAGVSRATFFNYFRSKDDVLAALWADEMDLLAAFIDQHLALPLPTRERIRRVFEAVVRSTERHPGYLEVVTAELEPDLARPEVSAPRNAMFHAQLRRLVDAGLDQGDVRTDHDPELLTEMIGAVYLSVLRCWRLDHTYDLPARSAAAATFIAEAVTAEAARG